MRTRRGQSTAEYAIVISVVIAAVVGMQLYVKRGLQGKTKQVMDHMTQINRAGTASLNGATLEQYEPYYALEDAHVEQNTSMEDEYLLGGRVNRSNIQENTVRTGTSTQGIGDQVGGGDDNWETNFAW